MKFGYYYLFYGGERKKSMNNLNEADKLKTWLDGIITASRFLANAAEYSDYIQAYSFGYDEIDISSGIDEIAEILDVELEEEIVRSYSPGWRCYNKYFDYNGIKIFQRFEERV